MPDEQGERVMARVATPIGDLGGNRIAESTVSVDLREVGETTIGGEATTIEGGFEGKRGKGFKAGDRSGRIGHEEACACGRGTSNPTIPV